MSTENREFIGNMNIFAIQYLLLGLDKRVWFTYEKLHNVLANFSSATKH